MTSYCPAYSITEDQTEVCGPISICPGTSITINGCGACTGTPMLGLTNSTGTLQSGNNYGGCGTSSNCAKFTYGVSSNKTSCEDYSIEEMCLGNAVACSGTVAYTTFTNPTPFVNVYSEYETAGCGGTPYVSQLMPVGSCVQISSNGISLQVTCDGGYSTSSWTAVSYPNGNCFGSFKEKLHGTDSSSCVAFTNTQMKNYKVSVSCGDNPAPPTTRPTNIPFTRPTSSPNTLPNPNNSNNSNSSDTVIIAGSAAGGAALVVLVVLGVLYFKGLLCFAKAPLASTAEAV